MYLGLTWAFYLGLPTLKYVPTHTYLRIKAQGRNRWQEHPQRQRPEHADRSTINGHNQSVWHRLE